MLRGGTKSNARKKATRRASALDGIPGGLPALMRAQKMQKKAARVGFDWPDAAPVFAKLREEIAEIARRACRPATRDANDIEDELGDLLFSVVNLARKLHLDAETALHRGTRKFAARFRAVEQLAAGAAWFWTS